jgi:transcriptional regulator with PAS, ATPase and Fis domain
MAADVQSRRKEDKIPMAAKTEEMETKEAAKIARAVKEHMEENAEVAEALEIMKQAQTVRNLPPHVLDRFSYRPLE